MIKNEREDERSKGPSAGARASAGLTLTDQLPVSSIAIVDVNGRPPADVWRDLARLAFATSWFDPRRSSWADARRDVRHPRWRGRDRARRLVRRSGAGRRTRRLARAMDAFAGERRVRSTPGPARGDRRRDRRALSAVATGPLAVFGLADRTETIAVRVGAGFREQRADQRRAVCSLLADLAQVADVRLVASGLTRRYLAHKHRADLPSVSDPCSDGPRAGRMAALVDDALGAFDPDGRPVAILRVIAADPAETLRSRAAFRETGFALAGPSVRRRASRPRTRRDVRWSRRNDR